MRLIDADALKKEVDNFQNCYNGWSDTYDKAYIIEAIEEAPTIEPKRGEWVDMGDFEQCSVCKGTHLKEFQSYYGKTTWVKTPYCPNCGADMRKGADDEMR